MKIGDRVKARNFGNASTFPYDRSMECGEEGIIVQYRKEVGCTDQAQIRADDGTLFCRTINNLQIIEEYIETYEIY